MTVQTMIVKTSLGYFLIPFPIDSMFAFIVIETIWKHGFGFSNIWSLTTHLHFKRYNIFFLSYNFKDHFPSKRLLQQLQWFLLSYTLKRFSSHRDTLPGLIGFR